MDVLYARCAGLDVHKDTVVACARLVTERGVVQEVATFGTTTGVTRGKGVRGPPPLETHPAARDAGTLRGRVPVTRCHDATPAVAVPRSGSRHRRAAD